MPFQIDCILSLVDGDQQDCAMSCSLALGARTLDDPVLLAGTEDAPPHRVKPLPGMPTMTFEKGQGVIHEVEVAGFVTKTVAVVASVENGQATLEAPSGGVLPGMFRLADGARVDAAGSVKERIVELPAPPGDLWGPRSGWISAADPPRREGWYEFRRAVDGSVDLCYFVAGAWLTASEAAPIVLTGGESWQGLAADPVELYLDSEPVATEPALQVAEPEQRSGAGSRSR
jgi:hypothetical protein